MAVGVGLALLWAFHAAATAVPGRAYYYLTGLNDISSPVQTNVLLQPAMVFAFAAVIWRAQSHRLANVGRNKSGLVVGLMCWFVAATASTILNWRVDQVVLTYWTVFVCGAAVYLAFSGIQLRDREIDVAIVALALGSLFPLLAGLWAFRSEWGITDASATVEAYRSVTRMAGYELATFGNRGNTAALLVIIAPMFVTVGLDRHKAPALRAICGAMVVPIVLNLVILQVRAAFVTLALALVVVWGFKIGRRGLPLLLLITTLTSMLAFRDEDGAARAMADRLLPAVTLDTEDDLSVLERVESIKEGWTLAKRHWLLGIGPGAALTQHTSTAAHQLQTQQAMELGFLGLIGSTLFCIGVMGCLVRTAWRGTDGGLNDVRFLLLIGPASFNVYGAIANATFNNGYVNTWTVLTVSMLALAPGFGPASRRLASPPKNQVVAGGPRNHRWRTASVSV